MFVGAVVVTDKVFELVAYCKRMRVRVRNQRYIKIPSKICDALHIPSIVTHVVYRFDVNRLVAIPVSFAYYGTLKYSPVPPKTYKVSAMGRGVRREYVLYIPKQYDVFGDEVEVCLAFACSYIELIKCYPYIIIKKL